MNSNPIKIGLEIHMQLDTGKLFCRCGNEAEKESISTFVRKLSLVSGEMGTTDRAAYYEKERDREFHYNVSDNSCLVEIDEDPPHEINQDALLTAVRVARAFGSNVFDHLCVMRKIVVDGSNTSGFQRTSLVATGGSVATSSGTVRVSTICLEEDSARRISEDGRKAVFGLDRLGIPLLEIATEPDIRDADHAVETARMISFIVASAGHFKRSAEAIRQDVNISLGFGRVEIKGVSKLSLIGDGIRSEIGRQTSLAQAVSVLNSRNPGKAYDIKLIECSEIFRNTKSKVILGEASSGKIAFCSLLKGMDGLLKKGEFRLGREIADLVKLFGVKGLLHSDELPGYGIEKDELEKIRALLRPGEGDAFMIVMTQPDLIHVLSKEIQNRLSKIADLDFSETRSVSEDGATHFLRPMPGGERMYPETDIPLIGLVPVFQNAEAMGPLEDMRSLVDRLARQYGISRQDSEVLVNEFKSGSFLELNSIIGDPRLTARVLLQTIPELERTSGAIAYKDLVSTFRLAKEKGLKRESVEAMLAMCSHGTSFDEVKKSPLIYPLSEEELKQILSRLDPGMSQSQIIARIRKETGRPINAQVLSRLLDRLKDQEKKSGDGSA